MKKTKSALETFAKRKEVKEVNVKNTAIKRKSCTGLPIMSS
ncbi:hypothetical protein [Rhizobium sp. BK176]|nr:hypothetical protein [Rhizobium sp. BK176]MCS4089636.1 hypothetical protein [Rhizobium sp. BK176]